MPEVSPGQQALIARALGLLPALGRRLLRRSLSRAVLDPASQLWRQAEKMGFDAAVHLFVARMWGGSMFAIFISVPFVFVSKALAGALFLLGLINLVVALVCALWRCRKSAKAKRAWEAERRPLGMSPIVHVKDGAPG